MIPNQLPSLNFDLGNTADMLRDSVMRFSSDEIAPHAEHIVLARLDHEKGKATILKELRGRIGKPTIRIENLKKWGAAERFGAANGGLFGEFDFPDTAYLFYVRIASIAPVPGRDR